MLPLSTSDFWGNHQVDSSTAPKSSILVYLLTDLLLAETWTTALPGVLNKMHHLVCVLASVANRASAVRKQDDPSISANGNINVKVCQVNKTRILFVGWDVSCIDVSHSIHARYFIASIKTEKSALSS